MCDYRYNESGVAWFLEFDAWFGDIYIYIYLDIYTLFSICSLYNEVTKRTTDESDVCSLSLVFKRILKISIDTGSFAKNCLERGKRSNKSIIIRVWSILNSLHQFRSSTRFEQTSIVESIINVTRSIEARASIAGDNNVGNRDRDKIEEDSDKWND